MARLWIMSDLHLETDGGAAFVPPSDVDHDVVVLAGDVAWSQAASVEWADATFRQPVVYVSGNHEHWGGHGLEHRLQAGIDEAAATEGRVRMLENAAVLIAGVRFLGCTLWTDFELDGNTMGSRMWAMRDAATGTPDYGNIRQISPIHISGVHARSRHWLEGELSKPFDAPTVVVTHHAPSGRSIGSDWTGATTSPAYASNLEEVIERFQPALWIHGHVHDSFDYRIGATRVLCNPRGFGDERGGFDPRMVVEV